MRPFSRWIQPGGPRRRVIRQERGHHQAGEPAPEPRSTQRFASGANLMSWALSRAWRDQKSSSSLGPTRFIRSDHSASSRRWVSRRAIVSRGTVSQVPLESRAVAQALQPCRKLAFPVARDDRPSEEAAAAQPWVAPSGCLAVLEAGMQTIRAPRHMADARPITVVGDLVVMASRTSRASRRLKPKLRRARLTDAALLRHRWRRDSA